MNNKAKKFLGKIMRDEDLKSLVLSVKGFSALLSYSHGLLTEFAIDEPFKIEIHGDSDVIEIVYPHGRRAILITVEADVEEYDDLLEEFNKDVAEKYKEKIENKTLNDSEAKEYLSSLLDYINRLTDKRANDLIEKLKDLLKNEVLELEIHDVVEVFSEDDIDDDEG